MRLRAFLNIFPAVALLSAGTASPAVGSDPQAADEFFAPSPTAFDPNREGVSSVSSATPNLFKETASDFRNLFTTRDNLLIVGVGLGAAFAARPYDASIPTSRFNSELYEGTELDHVFEPGQVLGGALVQVGGALTTFAVGKLIDDPAVESLGRDLIRAQILAQAVTQAVKLGVGRTRPDGSNNGSFPSGHAAGSFATATVLQRHYGWKVGLPAYGFAAYIAASRLSENKHYLSDVLFGAAVGIMGGRTVTVGRGPARFALSPAIPPGGGIGVQATLLLRE